MYTLLDYGQMIRDSARTGAYARALENRVTPSAVVLDIGAGAGILSLLACRAGARKVYAVEPDDVIQVAREAAAANGYADRIEFIQAASTGIELPERVDGIVSDLRGTLPVFRTSLVSLIDARTRFLKPGGWMIPARETLWAAPVSSPAAYDAMVGAWGPDSGLDWSSARDRVTNEWHKHSLQPGELIETPRCWTTLDYGVLETPHVAGEASWTISRAVDAHGLGFWFDAELAPDAGFTTAPSAGGRAVYGQGFWPWPAPVSLSEGDGLSMTLRGEFAGDDYVWRCETRLRDGASGAERIVYRQSSWRAVPLSAGRLRRRAATFVPDLTTDGRIARLVLELMEQRMPLDAIAQKVAESFPGTLPDIDAALARVGRLSERYSR